MLLISRGADVNAMNDEYGTPLHILVAFGSSESDGCFWALQTLLENGADVNVR